MTGSPVTVTASIALRCLDLTSLNDADDQAAVERLCARAGSRFGAVAAVCVWPRFAALARRQLPASIRVAAVANFPAGGTDVDAVLRDVRQIVEAGAQEVDVVLPWRALQGGDAAGAGGLLQAVRAACAGLTLKVILETGELRDLPLVELASRLALDAGADFLKTSTGKTATGATPAAAEAMLCAIVAHPAARDRAGLKASGGIRRVADALPYIALCRRYLGEAALQPPRFRIGASSLLDDIEAVLGGDGPTHDIGRLLTMLAQEIIRLKRDGAALRRTHIEAFVGGLVDGSWSEGQAAAMAMAIFLKGLSRDETIDLTRAMQHSGEVLDWADTQLHGPVLDKHSTGGVGDKVSLMLAPILAACGAVVPMISGRGLGHTGGTLDKFDSIPGYQTAPSLDTLRKALRAAGCAIIGQTAELAPADRRLYAIRDVTATVESIPLITASILSKKLAAGLQGLVMDVKCGNGAFADTPDMALALAQSLVEVANGAGLPTRALVTDMNQVLGHAAGNALEVLEAVAFLRGEHQGPRLRQVTRLLCAEALQIGRLATDEATALARVDAVLADGSALEHFARMVAALGGPADFCERPAQHLRAAPVQCEVPAPAAGWVQSKATRDIGLAVVELGGGRRRASDRIDHRVGFSDVVSLGQRVERGQPLARVHAADAAAAAAAVARLQACIRIGDAAPPPAPLLIARLPEQPVHIA